MNIILGSVSSTTLGPTSRMMNAAEKYRQRIKGLDDCIEIAKGGDILMMAPARIALNNMRARAEAQYEMDPMVERWPLARMVADWPSSGLR